MIEDIKVTGDEFEAYCIMNESCSDIDYRFNIETNQWDIPCVEWDGIYGKHWVTYNSEEERTIALNDYSANINIWVTNYRLEKLNDIIRRKAEWKRMSEINTLGNHFPELLQKWELSQMYEK